MTDTLKSLGIARIIDRRPLRDLPNAPEARLVMDEEGRGVTRVDKRLD